MDGATRQAFGPALQKLGKNIKKLRKDGELSQITLAGRVDITPEYLGKLERGVGGHFPSLSVLFNLARVLRVDLGALLEGVEVLLPRYGEIDTDEL